MRKNKAEKGKTREKLRQNYQFSLRLRCFIWESGVKKLLFGVPAMDLTTHELYSKLRIASTHHTSCIPLE